MNPISQERYASFKGRSSLVGMGLKSSNRRGAKQVSLLFQFPDLASVAVVKAPGPKEPDTPSWGVRLHTRERKDYATASMKCSRLSRLSIPSTMPIIPLSITLKLVEDNP
ncbi:hypothetical protein L1987_45898 [Smallanthus sonchifolius]|uniref:Uncharacterized protein n=1 Tax=Smallanthus sonchifolius TaxID=185202 RepID=A0ACB9FYC8_9ASTR|nr:hypothetical protein L1987_45898 [Smallanthus sonchifolius]